jgi:hypothetical protein
VGMNMKSQAKPLVHSPKIEVHGIWELVGYACISFLAAWWRKLSRGWWIVIFEIVFKKPSNSQLHHQALWPQASYI